MKPVEMIGMSILEFLVLRAFVPPTAAALA
jgi:hypothetical protein